MKQFQLNSVQIQFLKPSFLFISLLLFFYSQAQVNRIGSVTVWPSVRTACVPTSGTATVSYNINATRLASGTVNGIYTITGLPVGVTATPVAGFTAIGSTSFPARVLTLTISPSAVAGTTTFFIKVSDGADYATTKAILVLNTVPSLTVSDVSVNNDAGVCGSSQTFSAATTGAVSYKIGAASINSPYMFPIGTTTVDVSSSNSCGVKNASFNVTVTDAEVPVISGPGDITKAADAIGCSSVVNYSVSATDNCAGVTMQQVAGLPSGASFPRGLTKNTFHATDAAGNLSIYSFNVNITSDLTVDAGSDEQTYFGYTPDQTVSHAALASGGTGIYDYAWTLSRQMLCNPGLESFTAGTCVNTSCPSISGIASCSGSALVTATLLQPADVCVTVSDAIGCKAEDCFHIDAMDVRCGTAGKVSKVAVCHMTGGNRMVQLCLSQQAAINQLSQSTNDQIGPCRGSNKTDETEETITTQEGDFTMDVYPNPTNNVLNIEFEASDAVDYQALLFDNLGRKVLANEGVTYADGNRVSLPVNHLPVGVYYLSLHVGNSFSTTKVLVKE